MVDLIIDAADSIVGRVATRVCREALHGKTVAVVNAEKAYFSGSKATVVGGWKRRFSMGAPTKGPFVRRQPDRLFRRVIKGMLPKNSLGRAMFKKLKVYAGGSHEHAAQQPQPLEI